MRDKVNREESDQDQDEVDEMKKNLYQQVR